MRMNATSCAALISVLSIGLLASSGQSYASNFSGENRYYETHEQRQCRRKVKRLIRKEAKGNPIVARDGRRVLRREDVRELPCELRRELVKQALRPHTYLPQVAFSEADDPSQLF